MVLRVRIPEEPTCGGCARVSIGNSLELVGLACEAGFRNVTQIKEGAGYLAD